MAEFTLLEPISIGDIIDRSVRLYRRNFAALISVAAVPTLIGYTASLTFSTGYASLLKSPIEGFHPSALASVLIGMAFYPLWLLAMVMTISGISRAVGDQVMMGETITFRGCAKMARRRFLDILLMGLLMFGIGSVLFVIFYILMFVIMILAVIIIGLFGAMGLPPWMIAVVVGILALAAVAGGAIGVLMIMSRIVFLPAVLMIEGYSAGAAIGRAFRLGAGNWYKLGAITLFIYTVTYSIILTLLVPILILLYVVGALNVDLIMAPGGTAIITAVSETTSLFTLPIWIITLTLLYFDTRVRKEGYDVDLLARGIDGIDKPGVQQPLWRPPAQAGPPPFTAYSRPVQRTFVQTSPLGLAGIVPRPASVPKTGSESRSQSSEVNPNMIETAEPRVQSSCRQCGGPLTPELTSCPKCGLYIAPPWQVK